MKIFKSKKKDFIKELLKAAKKEKDGTLATKLLLQFLPKTELREPPKKKKPHAHYGNKPARQAYDGKIGLTNKHGVVGQAIANMKRDKILAAKMKG